MGETCAACKKPVYFAERLAANNAVFHKACFRCTQCGKGLTRGDYAQENKTGNPYCSTDYKRLFGPDGFSSGTSAFRSQGEKVPEKKAPRQTAPPAERKKPKAAALPHAGWKKHTSGCPKCGKTVGFAEKKSGPSGSAWHPFCLRCAVDGCNRTYDPTASFGSIDGWPYCREHFAKLGTTKAYGHGGATNLK